MTWQWRPETANLMRAARAPFGIVIFIQNGLGRLPWWLLKPCEPALDDEEGDDHRRDGEH
jgi:hypothetical protein